MTRRQLAEHKSQKRKELEAIYGDGLNFVTGDVIRYYKQFDEDGDPFTYIALCIDTDNWFSGGHYWTWGELLFELDSDNILEHGNLIDVATGWKDIER